MAEKPAPEAVPYFASEKIADGSWMIRNAFLDGVPFMCYLVEGRDYALLIDTMMGWGNLAAYCDTLTDKPVKLVNTHAHPDHTGGNFHFEACYLHARDIPYFQSSLGYGKELVFEQAKQAALPQYRELMRLDENFADANPIRVYPVYDGDVFDLGDRQIEVVEVGGHTPGSIVLIDGKTRIAYTGDACNGNTLLELGNCLPIAAYMKNLLHLKEHQHKFDMCYGGHEIFDSGIVDEGVETVARVLAGTDDHEERVGIFGTPVLYAAAKVEGGYPRVDGKRFNMSYRADRILGDAPARQVIGLEPPSYT